MNKHDQQIPHRRICREQRFVAGHNVFAIKDTYGIEEKSSIKKNRNLKKVDLWLQESHISQAHILNWEADCRRRSLGSI